MCDVDDEKVKYCMAIVYKDLNNPEYDSNTVTKSDNDINVNVRPRFFYYTNHCMHRF